jgi:acyl dehydratase
MSGTYTETPSVEVTDELVTTIVQSAGYTHRLFNPDAGARAAGQVVPLPGQGVLLLMGGLVEQSGALDHAVALLELRSVQFRSMVAAGTTLTVRIEELDSRRTSGGRAVTVYRWTGFDDSGASVVEAEAVMLMTVSDEGATQ